MAEQQKIQRGFTLIELMVTIVIAAILLTMAVPSYQDFIKRNAVESLQSRFAAAVVTARTEAASRNTTTVLCSTDNGTGCVADTYTGHWNKGWIVFSDANGDGVIDATKDEILLSYQTSGNYPIKLIQDNAAKTELLKFSFTNQGFTKDATRAMATFCEPALNTKYARGLTIERSGRVMKSRDTGTDGIHDVAFDTGTTTAPTFEAITCSL